MSSMILAVSGFFCLSLPVGLFLFHFFISSLPAEKKSSSVFIGYLFWEDRNSSDTGACCVVIGARRDNFFAPSLGRCPGRFDRLLACLCSCGFFLCQKYFFVFLFLSIPFEDYICCLLLVRCHLFALMDTVLSFFMLA